MFLRFTSYNLYIIKETYLNQACKISTLNSIASDFILKMNMSLACYFPANICWSSRRLQDMSWRRLQHVFSVTILRLPRRLEDVLKTFSRPLARRLEDIFKTSSRRLGRRKIVTLKTSWRRLEDVLKTCLEDVLKTCLEDVLKKCLEDVFRTSWRQTKCLSGISVSNKTNCVSSKSIFHKSISGRSKVNSKCKLNSSSKWNSSTVSVLRNEISDDC